MRKTCAKMGFRWPVYSRVRRESRILSLYWKIQNSENSYSCIFYVVLSYCRNPSIKGLRFLCTKNKVKLCFLFSAGMGYFVSFGKSNLLIITHSFWKMTSVLLLFITLSPWIPAWDVSWYNYNSDAYRGSHQRCSIKKVFLKISQNIPENTCTRVSFLIKLQS